MSRATRSRKKVPSYWWDIQDNYIVVECDNDDFACVGSFPFDSSKASSERAIAQANKLIADLEAGRLNPRDLAL